MTAPASPPKRDLLTLGPGSIVFDAPGGGAVGLDISCQVTDALVEAEADAEDPTPTLCGGSVAGARTYTWMLTFTTFQDVLKDGVIDWTWKNKGAETGFTFTPETIGAAKVVGRVMVDPISLGGTASKRNTSEVKWAVVGDPAFTPDVSAAAGTTAALPGAGA